MTHEQMKSTKDLFHEFWIDNPTILYDGEEPSIGGLRENMKTISQALKVRLRIITNYSEFGGNRKIYSS